MPSLSASPAATVLVVAPPTLQRQGLLATLRDARPDLPVTTAADAYALPGQLRRVAPTLLILDAALPGIALDDLIAEIRTVCPRQRILVIGGKKLPFAVARLIVEMGGGMLLSRHATPADLLALIIELIGGPAPAPAPATAAEPTGGYPLPPTAEEPPVTYTSLLPVADALLAPTTRELEVLQLVAADCSSQEIAQRLFISVRTVEGHRRTLLEKAGTRSMIGLVLHAVRQQWVAVR